MAALALAVDLVVQAADPEHVIVQRTGQVGGDVPLELGDVALGGLAEGGGDRRGRDGPTNGE